MSSTVRLEHVRQMLALHQRAALTATSEEERRAAKRMASDYERQSLRLAGCAETVDRPHLLR